MPILQAQIATDRASRYLVQFCKHAAAMGNGGHTPRMHMHGAVADRQVQVAAEWSEFTGSVTFTPWGRCTLTADSNGLAISIEAADEEGLGLIRDVVTRDFERFSRRDPMTVTWQRPDDPGAAPFRPADPVTGSRRHRVPAKVQTIAFALAVLLVVGLHIGLAGAAAAGSLWTGLATNVLVAAVLLKIVLIVLARRGLHRRRAAKISEPR